jgi:peptidylprolyl isomerase
MAQAKQGDTVRVHYTGKLDDGTVFDSSQGRDPLEFTLGVGQVIPGFEEPVFGMEPGDSKTVNIPAEKAYGPYHKEMVMHVERDEMPPDLNPAVGDQLQMRGSDSGTVVVTVTQVTDTCLTLDANHPLAGQNLNFDIELAEIV